MQKYFNFITLTFIVFLASGCGHVQEAAKIFWGSSVTHLEEARIRGSSKTFECSYTDCFDAVVALGEVQSEEGVDLKNAFYKNTNAADLNFGKKEEEKTEAESDEKAESDKEETEEATEKKPKAPQYVIFQKSLRKGYVVFMFVPGAVNTTEVGIFFTPLDDNRVRVEVSSLSTHAKITVSRVIYSELQERFGEIRDDRT